LLAEPDEYAGETIASCLERNGHEIIRKDNGEQAIMAITRHAPQLVLTEIMLPMRSGFEILGAVRGLGLMASMPVIFVTANASEREMDRALAAGISDYIVKPFHLRELALRVDLALGRREAALPAAKAAAKAGAKAGIARSGSGSGLLRASGVAVAA